jgi:adenylylsulfate kinase
MVIPPAEAEAREMPAARAAVIWFTGLPGAGKSTIADRVGGELAGRGLRVERLDGDEVRRVLSNTGFTRAERDAHIRWAGFLASKLERHGVYVVASFVSPYRESREFVRERCQNFIEVYVNTPLEACERRDPKGWYARARRGEVTRFTGIDDPYEAPLRPEVVVDSVSMTPEVACARVMDAVRARVGAL